MVLLDTDVMVDLLREYPPALRWLESLGEEEVVVPGLVVMELIEGCGNKDEQEKLEGELKAYGVVWPLPKVCEQALTVFARYHLSHGLGILDALIGQMAVDLDVALHTFNQKHYAAVPGLRTVQPYEKGRRP
ncbi:MAG: type II toxin-antitoxin system VapC family toxin [Planctomycetes bacterium]|nr:type II toxin-antitoxin system VapC family toxin [Planctomycetota bacterium]